MTWGTWEELILAFAVNRHGTDSWDSISSELQKRTSDPNLSLTAHTCRLKYLDLKRRYLANDDDLYGPAAPLLEELRKLRVAELRREVRRYDLNIESLEMKVKTMEEEREEKPDSDLQIKPAPDDEPGIAGDRVEESEKDQFSVNESNSTDLEAEKLETAEKEPDPDGPGPDDITPGRTGKTTDEPAGSKPKPDSCNGSSNSIEKTEPAAESDETTKENCDVQSTASRSRKEEGSDQVRRGNTSSDEPENEDQSHAVKEFSNQSQPLFDFLQTIRSHKLGSTFERRLRSQETSIYNKLILQHIDLETVETRLRQGLYSGSRNKFFRDLMLLANNALVFFPKKSGECNAANEIRALVSKEIADKKVRSSSSKKPEESDELSNPLMLKPRIPGSLIVCRKRSSIAAKADKKNEPQKSRITSSTSPAKKNSNVKRGKGESSSENTNKKSQTDSKKRGAANFLSRMKQDSSSNNGALLDALKNTPLVSEEKKNENVKHGEKKKSVGESVKEKGSPGKRNVGRPPKKGGGVPPGKRRRERGEAESPPPGKQKKRMRKL